MTKSKLLRMDNVGIVVEDLKAAIEFFSRLKKHGAELIGEMTQYEDIYRLCYIRGPEGIIVALAEQLGNKSVKDIFESL